MSGHGHGHGHGHDEHHGPFEGNNKRIALLISVIALFLALSETLGKSAQTAGLSFNVEASNLWAFYQAKTIRQTTLMTAAETMKVHRDGLVEDPLKARMDERIDGWQKTAARYESEPRPNGGEGRRELMARALQAEKNRDTALARYHHYEVASAAFQIGIVLASATVITGILALTWAAMGLAGVGIAFTAIGLFAPHAVHLF